MLKYDYLIVGAGLFGSIFAYEANKVGKRVLVIDKRNHIGGNCYSEPYEDYHIHKYGPHIFHTSNKYVWDYINQFATFNNFTLRNKANIRNTIYSLPINLSTIQQIWPDAYNPQNALNRINKDKENCIVLDTKWKNLNGSNPSPEDLRQMYVYMKYYSAEKVALIYPGNSSTIKSGKYFQEGTKDLSNAECSVITLEVTKQINVWQAQIAQFLSDWMKLTN